jgi:hypothetical protein
MKRLRKPPERVSWEQIAAAVPKEAIAFQAALAEADIGLERFCIWWDEKCHEEVFEAWEQLAQQFETATGLELWPYDERSSDGDVGFLVVGVWWLSPVGKRFFDIEDEA